MEDGRHGEIGTNVRRQRASQVMICLRQIHVYVEQDLVIIQVRKMEDPFVKE